jgi:hypothetical protein
MTLQSVGLAISIASFAITLGFVVWAAIRLTRVDRAVAAILNRSTVRRLLALPQQIQRIERAVQGFDGLGNCAGAIWARFDAVAGSAMTLDLDVRTIARATEDLLDTFVPSMRGSQAD